MSDKKTNAENFSSSRGPTPESINPPNSPSEGESRERLNSPDLATYSAKLAEHQNFQEGTPEFQELHRIHITKKETDKKEADLRNYFANLVNKKPDWKDLPKEGGLAALMLPSANEEIPKTINKAIDKPEVKKLLETAGITGENINVLKQAIIETTSDYIGKKNGLSSAPTYFQEQLLPNLTQALKEFESICSTYAKKPVDIFMEISRLANIPFIDEKGNFQLEGLKSFLLIENFKGLIIKYKELLELQKEKGILDKQTEILKISNNINPEQSIDATKILGLVPLTSQKIQITRDLSALETQAEIEQLIRNSLPQNSDAATKILLNKPGVTEAIIAYCKAKALETDFKQGDVLKLLPNGAWSIEKKPENQSSTPNPSPNTPAPAPALSSTTGQAPNETKPQTSTATPQANPGTTPDGTPAITPTLAISPGANPTEQAQSKEPMEEFLASLMEGNFEISKLIQALLPEIKDLPIIGPLIAGWLAKPTEQPEIKIDEILKKWPPSLSPPKEKLEQFVKAAKKFNESALTTLLNDHEAALSVLNLKSGTKTYATILSEVSASDLAQINNKKLTAAEIATIIIKANTEHQPQVAPSVETSSPATSNPNTQPTDTQASPDIMSQNTDALPPDGSAD